MLQLGRQTFGDDATLMMAIVNRTPDSFYDQGATWAEDAAFARVAAVVEQGAEIVDIGGIKAAPGEEITPAEEKARVIDFVARVRASYPELVISVDTWRAEVGAAACEAGADLLNDAWGGADPELVDVAAEHGAAIVCTHTGGATPRTRPFRIEYDDVVAAAIGDTVAYAERALAAGVARESIVIDPAHDFGKNTFHSLELTRRLGEMVDTGWPVLVSLSNKDFVGETLDLPVGERCRHPRSHRDVRGGRRSDLPRARGGRDPPGRRHGVDHRRPSPAAARDPRTPMRIALVPGVPALLPSYASIEDPVPDLRSACHAAVAELGPRVRVLASDVGAGRRVAEHLLTAAAAVESDEPTGVLVVGNGSAKRTLKRRTISTSGPRSSTTTCAARSSSRFHPRSAASIRRWPRSCGPTWRASRCWATC